MQPLDLLRARISDALQRCPLVAAGTLTPSELHDYAQLVRPTTDPRHGDYQANLAMPLGKKLGANPRAVAEQLVAAVDLRDICETPEIAGPGFINFKLTNLFLANRTAALLSDPRVGVTATADPKTIVVDYSSPNVAKPMHVGHIRSTVIGDAIAKVLGFLGHHVITDNHLGDWGTQFGMVIYGFKHFGDETAFQAAPVAELSRLYRQVNRLIEYHDAKASLAGAQQTLQGLIAAADQAHAAIAGATDPKAAKAAEKAAVAAKRKAEAAAEQLQKLEATIEAVDRDSGQRAIAAQHASIGRAVLDETVKLHAGDAENLALWHRFLPFCKDEINRVYNRLNVTFDHTLGESFYHSMLQDVVDQLQASGLARTSEGAVCVFLPEFDAPMIVQKSDGAFLYATTDLATLQYRKDHFQPHEVLYVVDTRQSEHFQKLFAVARHIGFADTKLVHVNFGTVLGDDGRPFKTRSGTSVGLESLLDDAVARAMAVVCNPDRASRIEPPLSESEKQLIANTIGHGAIKYADLSHHRASDYKYDLEKMVSLDGNTSAYVQYAYARTQGILSRAERDGGDLAGKPNVDTAAVPIDLNEQAERALALQLLRFGESLEQVRADYAPNFLVDYLYETAKAYAVFNDNCPVLKAETPQLVQSRLALVTATGRILQVGLSLLGIGVTPRM